MAREVIRIDPLSSYMETWKAPVTQSEPLEAGVIADRPDRPAMAELSLPLDSRVFLCGPSAS